jgi:hypothetical protein
MPNEPTSAVRAAPRPTRFSLAANYDSELVTKLAAYPVDEVYGKLTMYFNLLTFNHLSWLAFCNKRRCSGNI